MVTSAGRILTIVLESGRMLKTRNKSGNSVGDVIYIGHDLTNMKSITILGNVPPHGDKLEGHGREPKIDSKDGKYYDEGHMVAPGSGALHPLGVMEDSGVVLEFSDGILKSGRMRRPHELL